MPANLPLGSGATGPRLAWGSVQWPPRIPGLAGPALSATYNGPWTPGFLRRNEVLIPVENALSQP